MILTNSGVLKLMQRIKSYIASQLNTKAPSVHTHSISEIDDLSSLQMGGGGYSKSEVDTLLTGKADTSHTHTKSQITDFPSYGTTANTICEGNDSRLSDARTPTAHTHTKSEITDFPSLSTVATSGSYNDLSNKPTIPTVNNATLTIQKNGTTVKTFTANASSNVTANITVPTKVSELTNDSGFLTSHQSLSNYSTLANTIKSLSISGKTITYTKGDDTTGTLTTQDTVYTHPTSSGNKHIPSGGSSGQFLGWSADGTAKWVNNPNTNTWTAMVGATSSSNGSVGYVNAVPPKDGYNTKYLRADGTWQVPPDHTYTLSSLGIGNVKNYDQSKAIKSISRNGTTFTYTCLDGTTGTFTQQDNNTTYSFSDKNVTLAWGTKSTIATVGGTDIHVTMPANPNTNTTYSAGKGISLSGTTFSLKEWGVISTRTSAGSWSVSGNDKLFLIHFNIKSPQFNACSATLSVGDIICASYSLPTSTSYRTEIVSSKSFFESGFISNSSDTLYGVALVFGESNTITINFSGPISSINIRTFQLRR